MKVNKFSATTYREAVQKRRDAMGPDVLIIFARVSTPTINGPAEVTAVAEEDCANAKRHGTVGLTHNACEKPDKNSLFNQHAPLVRRLAFQLKARLPASVEVDDLIQAGMIGLLDAITRFETDRGAQFETYAIQRIRGSMLDELRSTDWLPRGIRQSMRKVEGAVEALQQQLGRPPSGKEMAEKLNMSLSGYQNVLSESSGHQLVYYEDFHDVEGKEHFLDKFASAMSDDPLSGLLQDGFKLAVVKAIDALPEREKLLLSLYYEKELNLKEVGAVLGVSESRVSQLHTQAMARLRTFLREQAWIGQA